MKLFTDDGTLLDDDQILDMKDEIGENLLIGERFEEEKDSPDKEDARGSHESLKGVSSQREDNSLVPLVDMDTAKMLPQEEKGKYLNK